MFYGGYVSANGKNVIAFKKNFCLGTPFVVYYFILLVKTSRFIIELDQIRFWQLKKLEKVFPYLKLIDLCIRIQNR